MLMKIFRIIEQDEPSHWAPYDDWLHAHGCREPRWWERAIDRFIHSELLFLKLPILFLAFGLSRRTTWLDERDADPAAMLERCRRSRWLTASFARSVWARAVSLMAAGCPVACRHGGVCRARAALVGRRLEPRDRALAPPRFPILFACAGLTAATLIRVASGVRPGPPAGCPDVLAATSSPRRREPFPAT